jgi:hypothetical protein
MVRESTYAYEFDSLRAVVDWRFWLRGVGLEEGPKPRCSFLPAPATLVRGVLFLPEADGEGRVADGVLLAVTGRAVMALRPGGNDVRHLPSGVYFLRMASGEGRTANSKVVIQR